MRETQDKRLQFPEGFLWGASTASHQVEGNNDNNDWWDWEQIPGKIHDGSRSGLACDQWNRYEQDFDLAKALHNNAHRLSLEWSRIEPSEGVWNPEAIEHYRKVLGALEERGLQPLVTLYHFTLPRWLAAKGGWENPQTVQLFRRYAAKVADELGGLSHYWATINEPVILALASYVIGMWPPGKKNFLTSMRVLRRLLQAHALAYHELHARIAETPMVSLVHYLRPFDAWNPKSPLDRLVARVPAWIMNDITLSALTDGVFRPPIGLWDKMDEAANTLDYIGFDYYGRDMMAFDLRQPKTAFVRRFPMPGAEYSMDGWGEICPDGLYRIIMGLRKYNKPIIVTETGIPDNTDAQRPRFMITHTAAVHRAIRDGAPVKGFFHWSLLDNFEWAEGYAARFGLYHTDFQTQERTLKRSGETYRDICAANAITKEIVLRHAPEVMEQVFES
jgi:beta-glucosidase